MVGDDADRDVALVAGRIFPPGHLGGALDEGHEQVGVEVAALALDDGGDALEAHAGVDGRPRQGPEDAVGALVELHEDEVPELDKAVAPLFDQTEGIARLDVRPEVVVDLGTGAARPGIAHGPEVVLLAVAEDPLPGDADLLGPEAEGLVVVEVDGGVEAVLGQGEDPGDEVPGVGHGLALEVVPEGEVAEHLEEGVVLGGPADRLEVVVLAADAHALLDRRRPRVAARLEAQEDVLELVHAGVGEQDGRVVLGQEGRAPDDPVTALGEIVEEGLADALGLHLGSSSGSPSARSTLLMPFSISSVAMSSVDWMPMMRSLKLSGLDEYFSPCSKEI